VGQIDTRITALGKSLESESREVAEKTQALAKLIQSESEQTRATFKALPPSVRGEAEMALSTLSGELEVGYQVVESALEETQTGATALSTRTQQLSARLSTCSGYLPPPPQDR
jgi:hypothetical protein